MILKQTNEEFYVLIGGLLLFITAFYGYENIIYQTLSTVLFALFIINKDFINKSFYWTAIIIVFLPIIVFGWQFVGNQKFIHLYILFFMLLSTLYKPYKDDLLKICAISCILIIFGTASIWKWGLEEFRSGDFLTFLLLSGSIFDFYAAIFHSLFADATIMDSYVSVFNKNATAIQMLKDDDNLKQAIIIAPESLLFLGKVMTYVALITQTMIPVSLIIYLKTKKKIWINIMHIFICEFIFLAFYPTKVIGFGMLLCVLGLILSHYYSPKYKYAYCFLFLFLIVIKLPIHQMILSGQPISYITGY